MAPGERCGGATNNVILRSIKPDVIFELLKMKNHVYLGLYRPRACNMKQIDLMLKNDYFVR